MSFHAAGTPTVISPSNDVTEAVAQALRAHRNLMVVTNNLNVANILAGNEELA